MSHENPHALGDAQAKYEIAKNKADLNFYWALICKEDARRAKAAGEIGKARTLRAQAREYKRAAKQYDREAKRLFEVIVRVRSGWV